MGTRRFELAMHPRNWNTGEQFKLFAMQNLLLKIPSAGTSVYFVVDNRHFHIEHEQPIISYLAMHPNLSHHRSVGGESANKCLKSSCWLTRTTQLLTVLKMTTVALSLDETFAKRTYTETGTSHHFRPWRFTGRVNGNWHAWETWQYKSTAPQVNSLVRQMHVLRWRSVAWINSNRLPQNPNQWVAAVLVSSVPALPPSIECRILPIVASSYDEWRHLWRLVHSVGWCTLAVLSINSRIG